MSQKFSVKSHAVTAEKIAAIEPLLEKSRMVGPESGLVLRLDDGTRHVWRAGKGESMPLAGDVLVTDPLLGGLVYVVPADKFNKLFEEA